MSPIKYILTIHKLLPKKKKKTYIRPALDLYSFGPESKFELAFRLIMGKVLFCEQDPSHVMVQISKFGSGVPLTLWAQTKLGPFPSMDSQVHLHTVLIVLTYRQNIMA